jgi:hypothetical protein
MPPFVTIRLKLLKLGAQPALHCRSWCATNIEAGKSWGQRGGSVAGQNPTSTTIRADR